LLIDFVPRDRWNLFFNLSGDHKSLEGIIGNCSRGLTRDQTRGDRKQKGEIIERGLVIRGSPYKSGRRNLNREKLQTNVGMRKIVPLLKR